MGILEIIGAVCLIITCILIIGMVLLQDPKGNGLGGLTGGDTSSYFDRNSGRTADAMLARYTKYCAIAFFLLTVGVYVSVALLK